MTLPKGYKLALWEFQQQVKKMRALKPFEAYERQFVQDRITVHAGELTPMQIFEWITKNLDMGGGGDATSHGRDILEAAVLKTYPPAKQHWKWLGPKRRSSTVKYFLNGGY